MATPIELLRQSQWVVPTIRDELDTLYECWCCDRFQDEGHSPTCELAECIKRHIRTETVEVDEGNPSQHSTLGGP